MVMYCLKIREKYLSVSSCKAELNNVNTLSIMLLIFLGWEQKHTSVSQMFYKILVEKKKILACMMIKSEQFYDVW